VLVLPVASIHIANERQSAVIESLGPMTFCTKDELSYLFDLVKESVLQQTTGSYGIKSQLIFFNGEGEQQIFDASGWKTVDDTAAGLIEAKKLSRKMNAIAVVSVAEGPTLLTLLAHNGVDTKLAAWKPTRIKKGKGKGKITDLVRAVPDLWADPKDEMPPPAMLSGLIEPKIETSATVH